MSRVPVMAPKGVLVNYGSWTLEKMAFAAVSGKGTLHDWTIDVTREKTVLRVTYKPNGSPYSGWTPACEIVELVPT